MSTTRNSMNKLMQNSIHHAFLGISEYGSRNTYLMFITKIIARLKKLPILMKTKNIRIGNNLDMGIDRMRNRYINFLQHTNPFRKHRIQLNLIPYMMFLPYRHIKKTIKNNSRILLTLTSDIQKEGKPLRTFSLRSFPGFNKPLSSSELKSLTLQLRVLKDKHPFSVSQ